MNSMQEQTEALVQNILASKYERLAELAELKSYTSALLASYHTKREAMAAAMKSALLQNCKERSQDWHSESRDTQRRMHALHRDRMRSAKDQGAWLASDRKNRAHATMGLMDGFRRSREESAGMMAKELAEFGHRIRTETHRLIRHAQISRLRMARDTASMGETFRSSMLSQKQSLGEAHEAWGPEPHEHKEHAKHEASPMAAQGRHKAKNAMPKKKH